MAAEERTLTREQLYDLVWQRPMRTLAAELGMSDVGLAKVCRRLQVPHPWPGYWARVQHGEKVRKPALPAAKHGADQQAVIRPLAFRTKCGAKEAPIFPTVIVSERLVRPHAAVAGLQELLRGRTVHDGVVSVASSTQGTFRAGRDSVNRALRILDAVVKAIEGRGLTVKLKKEIDHYGHPMYGILIVSGDESIPISIAERTTRKERAPEAGSSYAYPAYDFLPTGRLTLALRAWHKVARSSWSDGERRKLEDVLGEVVVSAEQNLAAINEYRARQVIERQREQERAREREIERQRAEYQEALVKDLSKMAAAWSEAQTVRAFLAAVAARVPATERTEAFAAWLAWATAEAERMDPLSRPQAIAKTPSTALDLTSERTPGKPPLFSLGGI